MTEPQEGKVEPIEKELERLAAEIPPEAWSIATAKEAHSQLEALRSTMEGQFDRIRALEAELAAWREVYGKHEWMGTDWMWDRAYCHSCGGYHPDTPPGHMEDEDHLGHKPDCRLKALLGRK